MQAITLTIVTQYCSNYGFELDLNFIEKTSQEIKYIRSNSRDFFILLS